MKTKRDMLPDLSRESESTGGTRFFVLHHVYDMRYWIARVSILPVIQPQLCYVAPAPASATIRGLKGALDIIPGELLIPQVTS